MIVEPHRILINCIAFRYIVYTSVNFNIPFGLMKLLLDAHVVLMRLPFFLKLVIVFSVV